MGKLNSSHNRFRFADTTFKSLGTVTIPLAAPAGIKPIPVVLDIVDADIPALLGLDVLDKESLVADTVTNLLTKRTLLRLQNGQHRYRDEWSIPLLRSRSRHVYAEMDFTPSTFFTRAQLTKIHRQFFHPSAEKLFKLLHRARPDEATPEALKILKDIGKRCDPCQRIQNAPKRFRVSFGAENVRFNERILLDIMYLEGKPVLHIVDEATRFSAARFLSDVSTKTIWRAILECWGTIYTGLPNRMLVDQGSAFGKLFISMGAISDVQVERTGIEAHASLGLGERYHQPLRQTYRKIRVENPTTDPDLALALSVKAMNDTLGPEGLVPSALVFGEFPPVFTRSEVPHPRATLESRAVVASAARKEMEQQMAKLRVRRALHHATPGAAMQVYQTGDQVLVWREKQVEHRIGEWIGPFPVLAVDKDRKLVFVQDVKIGAARPYNIVQVKRYFTPEAVAHSFLMELKRNLRRHGSREVDDMLLTEVISEKDPRAEHAEMYEARRAEIRNLMERGTFKVIPRESVPPGANVLPGRFVLAIKSLDTGKVKYKARYVVGGHRDRFKHMMVHSASTLQPQSVRLLLTLAAIHDFDVWTSDVKQAYLQSSEPISREIFIQKPAAEFGLQPHQCLQLIKPLYGLCESGDLWHQTMDQHHREDLEMKPFRSDPALYMLMSEGRLRGLAGGYVDDLIRAGDDHFKKVASRTNKRFEMAEDKSLPCTFAGFSLSRDKKCGFIQSQHQYLRRLQQLPMEATFAQFRSMRMSLGWLANTRPDCLLEISQLAQVTEELFSASKREIIRRLNKAISYAVDNRTPLKIPRLNVETLKIIGFSDASFANNADLTSQLGHICFLGDKTGAAAPVHFKSYKSRRVTRSVMAGEVIAFSDLFDVAATLASEIGTVLGKKIPVQLFTDSKSLFDVISKGSRTSEKRMMLDIAASREGFRDKVISDIGFVRSSRNLADGLTKPMNQAMLREVLANGHLNVEPEQWIVRGEA